MDLNKPEMAPEVPRDKYSVRDAVRPTLDVARGETGGGEALPEELEGYAKIHQEGGE